MKSDLVSGKTTATAETGGIRSIQRAIRLLSDLAEAPPGASLTELTQSSGLATSTVQRILATLEGEDVLRRLPDGRYAFGGKLVRVGLAAINSLNLDELVEPFLAKLSAATGETAGFAVLTGAGDVVYLRQTQSRHALRHASWLGRTFPPGGTAIGAALKGQVDATGTIATRKTLEPGVTAVAAPIHGPGEVIVGAINITGPTARIGDASLRRFAKLVAAEAARISRLIGGTASPRKRARL